MNVITKEYRAIARRRVYEILDHTDDSAGLLMFHYVRKEGDKISMEGFSGSAGFNMGETLAAFSLYAKRLVDETHEHSVRGMSKKEIWKSLFHFLENISEMGDCLTDLANTTLEFGKKREEE